MTLLTPNVDVKGYAINYEDGTFRTKVEGGFSKYRRDQLHLAHTVTATVSVGLSEVDDLVDFFVDHKGGVPFEANLVVDDGIMREYTCSFIPGTVRLNSRKGDLSVFSFRAEVTPLPVDDDYDESLIMMYTEYAQEEPIDYLLLDLNIFTTNYWVFDDNIDVPVDEISFLANNTFQVFS